MSKRIFLAIVGALALFAAGPAIHTFGESELSASAAKLNYYRVPGEPGWCEDPCDGAACCTTPGDAEALQ